MERKILSITIPTWNRSSTLDRSLSLLLPQVNEFTDKLELVISDNHSTDNTAEVVNKWMRKYPNINIVEFYQRVNTGFYGNFKKCKELANGKFIWMLSDDDFIMDNVITNVLKILETNENKLGLLYLNNSPKRCNVWVKSKVPLIKIFSEFNYRLTLISSSIFYNNKENNDFINSKFNNSHLIGFAMLVDVIRYRNEGIIMEANVLQYRMDTVKGYNLFDAFVYNIFDIFDYMLELGYPKSLISKFKENLIKHTWFKRYFYLKAKGELDGGLETYSLPKVSQILNKYFSDTYSYWLCIFPIKITPKFIIKFSFPIVEMIRNIFKK